MNFRALRGATFGVALGLLVISAVAKPSRDSKSFDEPAPAPARPRWLLSDMMELGESQPARLVRLAKGLFSSERLRMASIDPTYAFDWQHRLAAVSALAHLFDPAAQKNVAFHGARTAILASARDVMRLALTEDPSLLVRDGAVEAVRRVVRMQPKEGKLWGRSLERAFMDPKNYIEGEGLFIRETILMALREAQLKPSTAVRRAAERDANPQVRSQLRQWNTSAYESL